MQLHTDNVAKLVRFQNLDSLLEGECPSIGYLVSANIPSGIWSWDSTASLALCFTEARHVILIAF